MVTPQGGTEIIYKGLTKNVPNWNDKINLIVSTCSENLIDKNRLNYLWQHLYIDQQNVNGMTNPSFTDFIDKFIYISDFQKNEFQQNFPTNENKICVIRNAIDPIEYVEKPTDRMRLIYTSMPNRGLDILLDVLEYLQLRDIEVLVYSSNIIYGSSYARFADSSVIDRCKSSKYVSYKGYACNSAIRKAVQSSHILAYPSTFIETSCISAIEAGAAGCRIVTTHLGALPETCGDYAAYCTYTDDRNTLIKSYADLLKSEIENYDSTTGRSTSDRFNKEYSWEYRRLEWAKLLNV